MSGNLTREEFYGGRRHRFFSMSLPIPSYGLAILSGDLEERQIGPRTFIITEPSFMNQSCDELDILERTISEIENYTGVPYPWGVYKIAILIPNFPFGSMEHPLLNTVSPYLIVGDKSKVWVANHLVAHSWTGNLVTAMNWNNFWINEGFDVFIERKISKVLYGDAITKMNARNGNSSMFEDMLRFGMNHQYTSLTPKTGKKNPDASLSLIPYEKGYQFFLYLESLIGEDDF